MPVVNPATGEKSWSIDFLLADQYGVPTLVECKRRNDPRSRREVIGQMLEYAANGKHYWIAQEFRDCARDAAGSEARLQERVKELTGADVDVDDFFATMERNLQRSKMRLIFFLEDSPFELRSIVEFVNEQFTDIDLLIVEARQYQRGHARIVVPWVFGFTEKARVAKRESRPEAIRSLVKGEAAFWEGLSASEMTESFKGLIRDFISAAAAIPGCVVSWQRSCLLALPAIVPQKILLGIRQNGYLEVYLAKWQPLDGNAITEIQTNARGQFLTDLKALFGSSINIEAQFPMMSPDKWLPYSTQLTERISALAALSPLQTAAKA